MKISGLTGSRNFPRWVVKCLWLKGIAFGFDRWAAMFGDQDSIRDFVAFPEINSGRDVMLDTPSPISDQKLHELKIDIKEEKKK